MGTVVRILALALMGLALPGCEEHTVAREPVVASGDTWDLGFGNELRGGAPCFALDDLRGSYLLCPDLRYPELGSGVVEPLGSEGSLFFGTVPTRVATVEVALEDGSVVATNPFAPPATAAIERDLFVLELDQTHGSAVATVLDGRGRRLADADLRWEEDVGSSAHFEAL